MIDAVEVDICFSAKVRAIDLSLWGHRYMSAKRWMTPDSFLALPGYSFRKRDLCTFAYIIPVPGLNVLVVSPLAIFDKKLGYVL